MKWGPIIFLVSAFLLIGLYVNININRDNEALEDETNLSESSECYPFCRDEAIANGSIKIINLKLVDESRELKYLRPVDLYLNGVSGSVKVLENSSIQKISVKGSDMKLILPKNTNIKVVNLGVGLNVSYYEN